ncbi:MaoC family dehydratase N-terminal domain-containing protein [Blastococcus sp. URHD0036]|uniref:FAS1-like dehydratase domain-containing protein n=1 Tax=Blastococcus sp. URHD0036 TaxID=1380356 RepID=UPI000494FFA2|nr:MaoC family dehydratase N-terminal domain-containing protein [Blastococcus sp. URHD0036]
MAEPDTRAESLVTEEMRALMGARSEPRTADLPLTAEMLRRFVHGVMEEDRVHWDPEAAAASRYGDVVATPLFPLHAFRRGPGDADPFRALDDDPDDDGTFVGKAAPFGLPPIDLPLTRRLNGGTEAEFFQLAKLGDVITAQSEYVDISERRSRNGAPMIVLRVRTDYTNQDGAPLAAITTTMIAR